MNITVTFDLPVEKLSLLEKLLSEEAVPEVPAVVAEPVASLPEQTITKTMIRARGLELTKAGASDKLGEIFRKFGAEKLSGLKEEDYEEAYALMGELL